MTNSQLWFSTFLQQAYQEDVGKQGDVTSLGVFGEHQQAKALWLAKESGVFSGAQYIAPIFKFLDPSVQVALLVSDGQPFCGRCTARSRRGQPCVAFGRANRPKFDSTYLWNCLANAAAVPAHCVSGARYPAATPLLRRFEKGVLHGGGQNHRFGLYDMYMELKTTTAILQARNPPCL